MSDTIYRVKVEGEGLTLDREVPKEVGEKIVVMVLYGLEQPSILPTGSTRSREVEPDGTGLPTVRVPIPADGEITLGEFIEECQADTYPEKIVSIAYYLRTFQGQPTFTREQLPGLFSQAGESKPTNLNRDFRATIDRKWIFEPEPDTYQITRKGIQAVENHFDIELSRKVPARSARRTFNKKAKEVFIESPPTAVTGTDTE